MPVIYTSATISLAVLEILVHVDSSALLAAYCAVRGTFDEDLVAEIKRKDLPGNWREFPAPRSTQQTGDDWVSQGTSAVLKVPSTIIPSEQNYLFNPSHPDFKKIVIADSQPLDVDPRLLDPPGKQNN